MASSLPQTMRASQWTTSRGGIEKSLKLNSSAPLPKNAASLPMDHTLVRVAYTTPNPVDFKVAESAPFIFSKPATPCLDFAGTVVNSTLSHLRPGQKVFGMTAIPVFGAAAEYAIAGKESCVPVPDGVDLKQVAALGVTGLTAYQCLAPFIKAGGKVLINGGSGGTGTFGIQIAKALGCHVTTTCSGANVELCKSLGADEVIDYRTENVVESLKRSATQYDLIVDNVFHTADLYWDCHHYLKPTGKYVTIAGSPSISGIWAIAKVFLWPAFLGGGQRPLKFVTCTSKAEEYAFLAKLMQEGKLKATIEREFELEDAGKAFEWLKSGRTKGKLIIKVAGE